MTAHAFSEDLLKILEAGMNDRVTKPIEPKNLRRKLLKYLPVNAIEPGIESESQSRSALFLPEIDELDIKSGLERLNGNIAKYQQHFIRFIEFNQKVETDFLEAFKEKDFEKMHFCIHSLKGTTGNLGLSQISKKSVELENAIKLQSEEDIIKLFEIIQADLIEVNTAIEEMESRLESSLQTSMINADKSVKDSLQPLLELKKALEEDSFDAGDYWLKIKEDWGILLREFEEFELIEKYISKLNYEATLKQLKAMLKKIDH